MNLTQNKVIEIITTALNNETDISKVGSYPDEVYKIGKSFPSVMIGDGTETIEHLQGGLDYVIYELPIYIYNSDRYNRISNINIITSSVNKAVINSMFEDGRVVNVGVDTITKGDYSEDEDWYNPGFYPNLTIRTINFIFEFYTDRV